MAASTWAAAWAVAASLAGSTAWAGETAAPVSVSIRLDDLAAMPERDLKAAKDEMGRIFHAAGVDVIWVDATAMPRAGQLTLILLKHNAQSVAARREVAGQADRATSRAYVYRDRLDSLTRHLPVDPNVVLGRVMAHEIGHLLLPPDSHSHIGIMRPDVDFSQIGVNTFMTDQVAALHRAIAAIQAK